MASPRITKNKRLRVTFMFKAYLTFYAMKFDKAQREKETWFWLLAWASMGGKPDEVIGASPQGGDADGGVLEGTNRTTSGAIGQP
jgi:hypothetical protein